MDCGAAAASVAAGSPFSARGARWVEWGRKWGDFGGHGARILGDILAGCRQRTGVSGWAVWAR
jgi:hypothetical protein